ncbi:hypothetical protein Lal_00007549 [Lupinus albus]|uniref:Uncharacterized protein n=1 Tax=Lupinus albus TaxID=3870 RepID=A0A6A4P5P7_LUPAL|nr:hypothetical protein Lalb_Chr16g0381761 [Lupinus albus]KAF1874933.1 hypothetical protein Lal_00007549 [Lupinus albus]
MAITITKFITHHMLWRLVGFMSSIVGFTCYALSPSFNDLFGNRNPLKMVIYSVVSSIISILMLLVKTCRWEILKSFLLKAHVGFLVVTLTSLYSYWEDRSEGGKDEKGFGRVMNLTSTAAFAFMALSLSRLLQLGFEVGIFNFFIGCFLVTVMKMNFKLAPLAAFLCYLLVNIRSFSDFILEMRGHGPKKEHVDEIVETDKDTNSSDDLGYYDYEDYVQPMEDFGQSLEDLL